MNLLALIMLTVFGVVAVAANLAPSPKTAAKPSPKPSPLLSKYQRDRLEGYNNSAPADRYFGKLKLSYLGINNTLRDAAISSGAQTTDPAIVNKIAFAEDALTDWERRFPRDPQLARTYFLAIQSEKKIWIKANQERAWIYMNRIVKVFPNSYFGKIVKKDLAVGFTQHYYAQALPCPTPEPTASPTPEPPAAPVTPAPRSRGRSAPTPEPTPTPTPVPPTPEPTPVPTPESRTLGKGLKVQIEPSACVPPATPSPSPSPAPTASPQPVPAPSSSAPPAANGSPVPGASGSPAPAASAAPASPPTVAPSGSPAETSRPSPAASPRARR